MSKEHKTETEASEGASENLTRVHEKLTDLLVMNAERKREVEDQAEGHRREMERLLQQLVEVLDTLEQVFAAASEQEETMDPITRRWVNSFRSVERLLQNILRQHGVVPIKTLDSMFDPAWHTIVDVVPDPSHPNEYIVEESSKGYLWRGNVLRRAKVVAVRNG